MRLILLSLLILFVLPVSAEESPQVEIQTSVGNILLELDIKNAPVTVANFLSYVDDGSYKDIIFHRVIAGFMIQSGGYYADLSEAEVRGTIKNEADNGLKNKTGTIAMARTNIIDSAARQFFINVNNNTNLDHRPDSCTREDEAGAIAAAQKGLNKPLTCKSFGYAVFGKVISGMDVVRKIERSATGYRAGHENMPLEPVFIENVIRTDSGDVSD